MYVCMYVCVLLPLSCTTICQSIPADNPSIEAHLTLACSRLLHTPKMQCNIGDNVPVENTGGGGTALVHWRETTFGDELMTGYATGQNTISLVTILALRDLGYVVDPSKAEAFVLPSQSALMAGHAASVAPRISLGHDVVQPSVIGVLSQFGLKPVLIRVEAHP
jgi:hypothetical protein